MGRSPVLRDEQGFDPPECSTKLLAPPIPAAVAVVVVGDGDVVAIAAVVAAE